MFTKWEKVAVLSQFLTSKSIGKRLIGSHRRRWDDNIRLNLERRYVSRTGWMQLKNRDY